MKRGREKEKDNNDNSNGDNYNDDDDDDDDDKLETVGIPVTSLVEFSSDHELFSMVALTSSNIIPSL